MGQEKARTSCRAAAKLSNGTETQWRESGAATAARTAKCKIVSPAGTLSHLASGKWTGLNYCSKTAALKMCIVGVAPIRSVLINVPSLFLRTPPLVLTCGEERKERAVTSVKERMRR
jgi:hypothetical protein